LNRLEHGGGSLPCDFTYDNVILAPILVREYRLFLAEIGRMLGLTTLAVYKALRKGEEIIQHSQQCPLLFKKTSEVINEFKL